MLTQKFKENLLKIENISVKFSEPMKNHTSFKIGGEAEIFICADTVNAFVSVVKLSKEENIPFFILGAGSNILVSDSGIKGAVIKLCAQESAVIGNEITAEAGISLASLSKFAQAHLLGGLEFASGIPGTLGGAIFMNAGAYGGELKDVIKEVTYADYNGNIYTIASEDCDFGYRKSIFESGGKIILSCRLELCPADSTEISAKMNDFNSRRREKQPLNYPSAGSTFKRPDGYFAAKLIEDAGLKGASCGDAEVSQKHAGFVINKGNATAKDVLMLISHIQKTVKDKFGVDLEPEVRIIK